MPRRQFVADLAEAQGTPLPLGISDVKAGDDDGQIDFLYTGFGALPVSITAIIPELSEYPKSHSYMIFSGENAPQNVSSALENVRGTDRKPVFELLYIVSSTLSRLDRDRDGDSQMIDSHLDSDEPAEYDDDEDIYDSDHEAFGISASDRGASVAATTSNSFAGAADRSLRQRIRSDLRAAKTAGFKVGRLGPLLDGYNAYVTISVRVAKLGISDEAMQAWQVEPSEYLTLIIQYPNGYRTNEQLQSFNTKHLSSHLCMRVVAGKSYKPTLQETIKVFSVRQEKPDGSSQAQSESECSIRDTFISKPLMSLLQERLIPVLRNRGLGMEWQGAEGWYYHMATSGLGANPDIVPDKYFEPDTINAALPNIARADHYAQRNIFQHSFPVLAMQFLLRHFVRCTDFCLVCHRKLETDVEAIKPYVCDAGLCLYQLLQLGFGPSIEHEVTAQPYVVDLLVSFCFTSAAMNRLRDHPDGLALIVPPVDAEQYADMGIHATTGRYRPSTTQKADPIVPFVEQPKYNVGFEQSQREIIFRDASQVCPVNRGGWIRLRMDESPNFDYHCRVVETGFFPTITIDEPVVVQRRTRATVGTQTPATTRPVTPVTVLNGAPIWTPATFQVYNQDFSELSNEGKCVSICTLLDTLPSVTDMRDYLAKRHPAELTNWTQRISPSALALLRWIIASNRACIMQVDGQAESGTDQNVTSTGGKATPKKKLGGKERERCFGMKDFMQFRFAMGAPDKEQRFVTEVRKTADRLKLKYPTIFAFHGSPLHNWHNIIRQGLHFNNADHGRAYGDGVYHAKDANTSMGYSGMNYGAAASNPGRWGSTVLNISTAIALNEIVNAPAEFQSSNPYYVVKQLDWIQTRYLFVQVKADQLKFTETPPVNVHEQDPTRAPHGIGGQQIIIPAAAIKSGKSAHGVQAEHKNSNPLKKLKLFGGASNPVVINDEDDESVATDNEDRDLLLDEPASPQLKPKKLPVAVKVSKPPPTDFVPGALNFGSLPIMPLPIYASSGTTKHLMKELQALQKIQSSTHPAELGWYIDAEQIENVYQWIVELHSFHTFDTKTKPLPLSIDMKKQKITSIVLEIRFNKDFPFSPPYVRVIRPRCLSLMQGGGGHVVMGGAMCMELLTNTGWSSVSTMESVLMQIRMAIASEPYARLDVRNKGDYGTGEAADGYMRACATHGWEVPAGFKEMAYSMPGKDTAL
jgi:ubiquitin-conjugating enzyme E2 Q